MYLCQVSGSQWVQCHCKACRERAGAKGMIERQNIAGRKTAVSNIASAATEGSQGNEMTKFIG